MAGIKEESETEDKDEEEYEEDFTAGASEDEVMEDEEMVELPDLPELGEEAPTEVVLDGASSALNLVYLPDDRVRSTDI